MGCFCFGGGKEGAEKNKRSGGVQDVRTSSQAQQRHASHGSARRVRGLSAAKDGASVIVKIADAVHSALGHHGSSGHHGGGGHGHGDGGGGGCGGGGGGGCGGGGGGGGC